MNKLPFIIIFAVLFLAFLGTIFLKGDSKESVSEVERLQIATTIFPLFDIVKNIAGEKADIHLIVPPGVSPHTFEITPIQMRELRGINILFEIGVIDEWARLIVVNNEQTQIISLADTVDLLPFREIYNQEHELMHEDEEMNEHEGDDPHYWLSPQNAKKMALGIYNVLVENDPVNTEEYTDNLKKYTEELDKLDADLKNMFRGVENRNLITFHDSWQYFEIAYGLKTVAVVESSPGADLLPEDLKNIHEVVEIYNITSIFSEPQLSVDQIMPLMEDLNLKEYIIDPLGGVEGRDSYISLMKYNATIITQALTQ